MQKKTVAIGLLGTQLDRGQRIDRWERWRPTVSLCQQEELVIDRLELLHAAEHAALASFIAEDIGAISPATEVVPREIAWEDPWDLEEVFGVLHDFARGYPFDTDREDYLLHISTGTHVAQICLFLLTESRHFPARLVQTQPGRRGERRAAGVARTIDLDLSRYDQLAARFLRERDEGVSFLKAGIETRSQGFNQLIERIEEVAIRSPAPILLTGPTGAGKSRLARRIYELKRARHQIRGDLIEVNCATLRGDGAASTLFGHVKGSFTGALRDRPGLLRAADGGVLFLDEIGELGLDEQAMLLRAIELKRFMPVGSDREVSSDFQLIAGTNRDLLARVREGAFREDLLARINLWTFRLPGLRDRPEDIAPNVDYELQEWARRGGDRIGFNREARERFLCFAVGPEALWSGNFRDLNAAITRMATLAPGARITDAIVDEEIERLQASWGQGSARRGRAEAVLGTRAAELDRFDRSQLEDVLEVCARAQSLSDAGRILFSESRKRRKSVNDADRIRKYLARFDLTWEEVSADRS